MSYQADALLRHILRACATPTQRKIIKEAFDLVRQDGGSGNTTGDLERICLLYLAEQYTRAHMEAIEKARA